MSVATGDVVTLHAYTGARRHPKVVGVIGGHVMPWTSTNAQMAVFLVLAVGLIRFRSVWGVFLPTPLQIVLIVGLPCLGWWAARHWHPEDREPLRAAVGMLNYATRARQGTCNGRRQRTSRGELVTGRWFCSGLR